MQDWTDDHPDIIRILKAIQPLEEIGGPELPEYLAILEVIKEDIETRIANAKKAHYGIVD